jgi:hypothetical protein
MIKDIINIKKHLGIQLNISNNNIQLLKNTYTNMKQNYNKKTKYNSSIINYGVISKNKKDSLLVDYLRKHSNLYPKLKKLSNKELCKFLDTSEGRYIFKDTFENIQLKDQNWEYFYNNFISLNIITDIETADIKSIVSNNDKLNLYTFSSDTNENKKYTDIIYNRLTCLDKIGISCFNGNIRIWLSDIKKQIENKKDKVLTFKNINSGMCCNRKHISLWRKEELPKVIVHEYIHLTKFDFVKNNEMENFFYNNFNINKSSRINPFEAQTELLAIVLNTLFVIIEKNISFNKFIELLEIELTFSLLQCAKILYHYSFNTWEEFIDLNNPNKLTQETNVFSYFILKCFIFFSIDEWFNFQRNNHTTNCNNQPIIWNMCNSKESLRNWYTMAHKCSKNKKFIKYINTFIKSFDSIKSNELYTSLRMTIIE